MAELIWDGKYDKDGKKVAPLRVPLPFQTVETINESAQQRQLALEAWGTGKSTEWRNRLIWGDKKYVLPSLLQEFAGQVDLIYIDPPFDTGADFSFLVQVDGEDFTKEPSIIEQKAYRDTWGRGLDSYLQWFYETIVLLRELLSEYGSIYVHLDWHVGQYAKAVIDEVIGTKNYEGEIVWQKLRSVKSQSGHFANMHDNLYVYSKSDRFIFTPQFVDKDPKLLETHYRHTDPETGRRYNLDNFTQAGPGPARRFRDKVIAPPPGKHWIWSQERIDEAMGKGMIVFSKGGLPYIKRFFDDGEGTRVGDIWTDINPVNQVAKERVDFPTQKPESLLERIIRASSNQDDLVLDCFVGSGTTAAVAEKLGRRWIACDLSRFAIHTTRKRLLGLPSVRPFVVQNLGKYERQLWQAAEFGESAQARIMAYRRFILELYKAQPITGYSWLHGVKAGRMVHVGAVDSPVSTGDISQIATEFRRAVGSGKDAPTTNGVDVLGWDFAFELNEVARQQAAQANINLRFLKIPHDAMDRRAVEQGDVRFFELAALSVDVAQKGLGVTLTLTDFVIPPDDVPEDVRRAIKHWSQWVDYWAVDWANKGDTFHNEWQTYRTHQNRELQKSASHTYDAPGEYTIVAKVIDILGNDTTRTIKVEVPAHAPDKAPASRTARAARSAR